MLDYKISNELLDDINNINEETIQTVKFLPMSYIILSHLYHIGNVGDQYICICDTDADALFLKHIIGERIMDDRIQIFYHDLRTISLAMGTSIQFLSMETILNDGLPDDYDDGISKVFLQLYSPHTKSDMVELIHECLFVLADGDIRDIFVGITTDNLTDYV